MRPKGEDVAQAVNAWFVEEIKNSSSGFAELGKFFFGISSGALGFMLTLAKISDNVWFDALLLSSLGLYAISFLIAITMVQPRVWLVSGDTDLYEEYRATVRRGQKFVWAWFLSWICGTIFGVVTLFVQQAQGCGAG